MASEDKGNGMGSVQDPSAGTKSGEDSSLSARRARLRGTLAKQVSSPDPYNQASADPYAMAAPDPSTQADAYAQAAPSQPAQPTQSDSFNPAPGTDNGNNASAYTARAQELQPWEDPQTVSSPSLSSAIVEQAAAPEQPSTTASAFFDEPTPQPPPSISPITKSANPIASAGAMYQAHSQRAATAADTGKEKRNKDATTHDGWPSVPLDSEFETTANITATEEAPDTVAAAPAPPEPEIVPEPEPVLPEPPPPPVKEKKSKASEGRAREERQAEAVPSLPSSANSPAPLPSIDPKLQEQAVEVLNNIDQAMGACAMNLSALQKIATEQTDALRTLADTMQNQNFFEIGLNLNSMIESMSAALEPMKAVGELVPAIDQLVIALETKDNSAPTHAPEPKLTPEQLLASLADQLSNGIIDPWTFKSAYMAIYPNEHPADLVNRLVQLVGTQKLSGDLFRAAFDAIQSADGPAPGGTTEVIKEVVKEVVKVVQDESLLAELAELKRANEDLTRKVKEPNLHDDVKLEELQSIIQQMQSRLEQRESEFNDILAAKDRELQEAQELLTSRWEEFNSRYDELTETLQKRDEMLSEKEAELARKEIENQQLKTQMEELRDQTKDMVTDLQKQLTAAAKPKEQQAAFFDPAPANGAPQTLFDPAPARPLFQPGGNQQPQQPQLQQQQEPAPQPAVQPPPQPQVPPPPPPPQPNATNQAIPRPPATTSAFSTVGSYGSGVRQQVFEVIVRQALAGAPWREICAGPMQVNNITPEEVEAEVKRRQALLKK